MATRRSMLIRGPGLLLVVLIAVAIIALASRGTTRSQATGVTPTIAATATQPAPTPPPTATAVPSPTPVPAPHGTIRVIWQRRFVDPWWHTWGSLLGTRVSSSGRVLSVLLDVTLVHRGHHSVPYAHRNFFAVDSRGRVYPTVALHSSLPALRWGSLHPVDTATGWIQITLPLRPLTVTVVWNDHNHLRTPFPFLRFQVR